MSAQSEQTIGAMMISMPSNTIIARDRAHPPSRTGAAAPAAGVRDGRQHPQQGVDALHRAPRETGNQLSTMRA